MSPPEVRGLLPVVKQVLKLARVRPDQKYWQGFLRLSQPLASQEDRIPFVLDKLTGIVDQTRLGSDRGSLQ